MKRIYCTCFLIIMFFVGCVTQRTSTIVSCNYDKKTNQTNYMVFPYGSVSIPDQWERTGYNKSSRQQFFRNKEGVVIAIAFGPSNKFEFNANNSKKEFQFVKAFYEWDSQYFVNSLGLKQVLIEENDTDNYIIWRIYGEYDGSQVDTYFLVGDKRGIAHNYSLTRTDSWTIEQKIEFLKRLYLVK